jgi:hypothetical protein
MAQLDDLEIRILRALPMTGPTFSRVFEAFGGLGIEEGVLSDKLESLADKGLIKLVGLGGGYAPGMTLPNGIHNVGLTAEGRQFLRGQR